MNNLERDYNSTYISSNLIDGLDYVIGCYGKPNLIFIFTLSTFLEAFILNNSLFNSSQELIRIKAISKSLFPIGQPVLKQVSNKKTLSSISGMGNDLARVINIDKFDD